ncbi:unnamed protein product [Rhizopus microsporus]
MQHLFCFFYNETDTHILYIRNYPKIEFVRAAEMTIREYTHSVFIAEIEQDLTATEEVNVNLQVLLEKAVKSQKESDVCATQTIRNMYTELASVVYENNQLQSRLASLESHQREQVGNVYDITRRMQEYTHMLEQAQGTIHMLQEPRHIKMSLSSTASSSRRTSTASFTEDDDEFATRKETHMTNRTYIQSPPLGPQQSSLFKPQQGLRMLLQSQGGSGLGSLTRR